MGEAAVQIGRGLCLLDLVAGSSLLGSLGVDHLDITIFELDIAHILILLVLHIPLRLGVREGGPVDRVVEVGERLLRVLRVVEAVWVLIADGVFVRDNQLRTFLGSGKGLRVRIVTTAVEALGLAVREAAVGEAREVLLLVHQAHVMAAQLHGVARMLEREFLREFVVHLIAIDIIIKRVAEKFVKRDSCRPDI